MLLLSCIFTLNLNHTRHFNYCVYNRYDLNLLHIYACIAFHYHMHYPASNSQHFCMKNSVYYFEWGWNYWHKMSRFLFGSKCLPSFLKDISAEYSILGWHPFSLRSFKITFYTFLYSLSQLQVSFLSFTTLLKTLVFPLTYLNSLYLHLVINSLIKICFCHMLMYIFL